MIGEAVELAPDGAGAHQVTEGPIQQGHPAPVQPIALA